MKANSGCGAPSPAARWPARWDAEVGIVGAGPAGARAAELLAALGVEVIGFDSRAPWEKPCGGGLPAAAFRNVPELAEVKALGQQIRKLRLATVDGPALVLPLSEPLYVVSRRELGVWQLARARAAGARLIRAGIVEIEPLSRGWRLQDGCGLEYRVRRLVGADGAASRVRYVVARGFRPELAPTRVAYPVGRPPFPAEQVLFSFIESVHGYLWDFPRADHRSVGVGLTPGTWSRGLIDAAVLRYLGNSGAQRGYEILGAVIGTAMWPARDFPRIGGPDYALLGDAAGLADPATGEGIENALRSAGFLAEAFERRGDFALYPRLTRSVLLPEFRAARLIRSHLYRRSVAERGLAAALRWPWACRWLQSLVDYGNEARGLGPLMLALLRPFAETGGFRSSASNKSLLGCGQNV